jgi:hypothetical protein
MSHSDQCEQLEHGALTGPWMPSSFAYPSSYVQQAHLIPSCVLPAQNDWDIWCNQGIRSYGLIWTKNWAEPVNYFHMRCVGIDDG